MNSTTVINSLPALTEKETAQLNAFRDGMDAKNSGWLHEMSVFEGKTLSGVVSSLVKKGAITSFEDDEQDDCFWVEVDPDWRRPGSDPLWHEER